MAAYEVLLLNTAIPQIQAAQSGDTYVVPRDIAFNAGVNVVNNDVTIYGVTVGRGAGAVATNTAVGASALAANTTGYNNTAISQNSGAKITTGYDNISIGISSNGFNSATGATTGNNNVAVGDFALTYLQSGSSNTAVGSAALNANTTASNNTAVGYQAGYTNQTGSNNVANGYQALFTNTSDNNVAVGYQAGHGITTGANNTTIGHLAGKTITTGSFNVAVGRLSMDNSAGVTGTENTAVGNGTLRALTSGINNTVIGTASGSLITTGSKNTILGAYTGNQGGIDIRTSSNNIVLSDGDGNPRQVYNNTGGTSLSAVPLNAASIRGYELGTGGAAYHGNGARSYITANGYWNDVQWTRPLALPACQIVLDHNSGNIVMQSAVTGSAGSAIAFTQVFGVNIGQTVALQGATPQNGTGITFPATQSASSNAKTLDDYEEGTWTPTLTFGGGSTGITYGDQSAQYVKIGRNVYVNLYIFLSNKGSSTGQAAIAGFPFPVTTGDDFFIPLGVRGNLNSSGNQVSLYSAGGNTTTFTLYQCALTGGSNSVLTDSAFNNSTELNFNFWYRAAS